MTRFRHIDRAAFCSKTPWGNQPLTVESRKFNLISTLSARSVAASSHG
jgi:hypothetical protein